MDVYKLAQTDLTGAELYPLVLSVGAPNATPFNLVYGKTCSAHWENLVLSTRHEDPWLTPQRRRRGKVRGPRNDNQPPSASATATGQTTRPSRRPQPTTPPDDATNESSSSRASSPSSEGTARDHVTPPLSPEVHVDPSTPADDPAFDGHTWLHRHVLRRFGNAWFLGKITRATLPADEDGWGFHVINTDGDKEDLSRNKVAADIVATRPTNATGLVGTPE